MGVDENEMCGREDYYDYHYHQDTMLWLLTRMTTMVAVTCTSPINNVPGGIQLFRTDEGVDYEIILIFYKYVL